MKTRNLKLLISTLYINVYKKIFNRRLLRKAKDLLDSSQTEQIKENYKLVIKNTNNNYTIVQKTNRDYVIYEFHKNTGDLSDASVGEHYELLRLKSVEKCFDCFLWKEPNFVKTNIPDLKVDKKTISNGLLTINRVEPGKEARFKFNSKLNNIAYLSKNTTNITVCLDNKFVKSFNSTATIKEVITEDINIPLNCENGEITIKNNGNSEFDFVCFNLFKLKDYNGEEIDRYRVYKSSEYFINSVGASDYAISDYDEKKWCGSYHGGEVLESGTISWRKNSITKEIELDRIAEKQFSLVKDLKLIQKTNLNSKGTMLSTVTFSDNGSLNMNFKLCENKINSRVIYTALTCVSPNFIILTKPNKKIIENGNNYIDNIGYIEQYSYDFSMKIGIKYDIIKGFKTDVGSNIYHNMNYSKFYYGIVLNNGSINISELEFNKKIDFYNLKV